MTEKNKVTELRDALLEELISQVRDGITVMDKESGEPVKISTSAAIMGVAAKVVKDFAHELSADDELRGKAEKLATYLAKRRGGDVASVQ
jgi:hypothetical protein